ncbi:ParB/RepB/Spo0J family partition protein [Paenibacillus sp. J5C_2022]|uniref:ParB/RepB/Spo0J family partition protein n=1 Tax=Paenibacillus sp. J5C2022 TaxID=2977129 RepID=UPI0021CF5104|nr:ParB/RepB/Spo0J family partition protein [Paenibacillus sp. J5C2022]MCU6711768.1 ParB/RepB/Spo0J family partition protein [Paenibacillus sp. J5C2022]
MNIIPIEMELIDEDKDQPRYQFQEEALQELMNSIQEIGLLSPIKVRKLDNGRYKIIYGNRRYKASKLLGLPTIPCIVSSATDEMEIYLEQIAENLTRENFSPIEEAEAFNKLLNDPKFRSSVKFLSAKLGKPESYIKNKCDLLVFSNAVKKLIVSGTEIRKDRLTEEQLMPLKSLPMEYRDTLALTAARDELPVSDIRKIAKLFKDKSISEATKDKLLLKSGSGLLETWSTFEQNRKEKARKAEEQAERVREAEEQAKLTERHAAAAGQPVEAVPPNTRTSGDARCVTDQSTEGRAASLTNGLTEHNSHTSGAGMQQSAPTGGSQQWEAAAMLAELQAMRSTISGHGALSDTYASVLHASAPTDQGVLNLEAEQYVMELELLLGVWKKALAKATNEQG